MTELKNIRVLEYVNGVLVVIKCTETDWSVCCGCIYFGNEKTECIFKERNRMGIVPNIVNDWKKYRTKFLMELKNKGEEKTNAIT